MKHYTQIRVFTDPQGKRACGCPECGAILSCGNFAIALLYANTAGPQISIVLTSVACCGKQVPVPHMFATVAEANAAAVLHSDQLIEWSEGRSEDKEFPFPIMAGALMGLTPADLGINPIASSLLN